MTKVDLVSLGEVMLRLTPPINERLRSTTSLEVRPCGAQFNIVSNFAALGQKSVFLTKLPDNDLGLLAFSLSNSLGVDMSYVRFEGDKIGMVFAEFGSAPRQYVHIYDRQGSSASQIHPDDFNWNDILAGAYYAYTDGIFPALNKNCFETTLAYLEAAKNEGCITCFDINYRQSLWKENEALEILRKILPQVDVLVSNRTVSEQLFNYTGSDYDLLNQYQQNHGCKIVILTYKEFLSSNRGTWYSKALLNEDTVQGRLFEFDIVDPFGAGDAFFAGFLYCLEQNKDLQYSLDFGNALCTLAHTIYGDAAVFSSREVEDLMREKSAQLGKR